LLKGVGTKKSEASGLQNRKTPRATTQKRNFEGYKPWLKLLSEIYSKANYFHSFVEKTLQKL
jgi:hypothetical protein